MLRKAYYLLLAVCITNGLFAQGTFKGNVKDSESGEPVPFANVSLESNGNIITGGMTDFDGKFTIKPIPAGKYDVKVSYVGYAPQQLNGVRINANAITFQDFSLKPTTQQLNEVQVTDYKVPLISKDQTSTGGTVTSEDIAKMPGRSAESVAITVGGVYSEKGEVGSIRGARSDGTVYYIDGVKVIGSNALPKSAVEEITVVTGGLPAKFGDATGGIISISTKGPSKETFGAVELVTSKFLDPYGYNLGEAMLSGPLFSKKIRDQNDSTKFRKEPVVGYFISASTSYIKDDAPFYTSHYSATDENIQQLIDNPIRESSQGSTVIVNNANFYQADAFKKLKAAENAESFTTNLTGKIDFKPTKNINVTIGGTYYYSKGRLMNRSNDLFNSKNNGQELSTSWRAYVRLTQKFSSNEDAKESSASAIKNAYYQIQFDYSKQFVKRQDINHKDNLFDYGHIGKFTTTQIKTYRWTDTLAAFPSGVYQHDTYADVQYSFDPSTSSNPDMASIDEQIYANPLSSFINNADALQEVGGLLNGEFVDKVYIYGMYAIPGLPYNSYAKWDNTQLRISAQGSADVKDHEVTLGFEFEQRDDRYYNVIPADLWTLARKLTNEHISQLDINNPHIVPGNPQDTVWYDRLYNPNAQSLFAVRLRQHLGIPVDSREWVDLDSYDPEELSIEYFSPDELFKSGDAKVAYAGFDAYGKKLNHKPSFDDFFTATFKDEIGIDRYKRETAPFMPNYTSAFIQDKFAFKDLVFNVGIRVDRYDANQMVLKDPYSLYETMKVRDVPGSMNVAGYHPQGIGEDYVVYVDRLENPTTILGYRSGLTPADVKWFKADGTLVADPDLIASATGVIPYVVDANAASNGNISSKAFKDYDPQITVMPRISFSFPISDVALFFAHYDILSKRPNSAYGQMNPYDYLYLEVNSNTPIANPNLKPEKTIDYELGFQQKLSNTSSLKLSAFYREMRDLIQIQMITGGFPVNYMTYSNVDFGTVKGLTIGYDMRRTGNTSLRVNYTLQFANGTGSNAETSRNLITAGFPNLRTTIPLDFDQRHQIQTSLDYRFASGREYNGPKWFGVDLLQNTGANLVIQAGSGSPYTRRDVVSNYVLGSVNGSRKPWRLTMNLRIDRDIELKFGKKEGNGKSALLNVYVDISNLLNTKTIVNVYGTTGNPEDNGYLSAASNQATINAYDDPAAYRNYYTMWINSPYNYGYPRMIRLGAALNF